MRVVESEPLTAMPYESRESLVALMYRLQTRHRAPRTLVLLPSYWGEFAVVGWDGEVVVRKYPPADADEFAAGSFDRIALHWVLDEVGRGRSARSARELETRLLDDVRRWLVPGGEVAGVVANWLCLGEREGRPLVGRTAASCRRLLARAGFDAGPVSVAVPSGDVPRSVISMSRRAARHYFRRQLAFTLAGGQDTSYLALRRAVAETGIGRYLQGSLVFSGTLRC